VEERDLFLPLGLEVDVLAADDLPYTLVQLHGERVTASLEGVLAHDSTAAFPPEVKTTLPLEEGSCDSE
jgi:hypothetical protein